VLNQSQIGIVLLAGANTEVPVIPEWRPGGTGVAADSKL